MTFSSGFDTTMVNMKFSHFLLRSQHCLRDIKNVISHIKLALIYEYFQ